MPNENTMELGIDSATLMLVIGNKTYTLVSEPMAIHIPGSAEDPRFHFKYKDNYDESINLGTAADVVSSIEDMFKLEGVPSPRNPLKDQWESLVATLGKVPFFDSAIETIADTQVQIVEIEARLGLLLPQKTAYETEFRFGLMFTPAKRPRLFNIQVQAFGATLSLKTTIAKDKLFRIT